MMRWAYSLMAYCAVPPLLAYLWWRGRKDPRYRQRWSERFAHTASLPMQVGAVIVHCGSVGEVLAARPLVEQLLADPRWGRPLITCSTPTGTQQIQREFGDRVDHCYFPLDLPGATRRFLSALRPRLVILLERELWPNFLYHAQTRGVPVVVANARLSPGSARGYARWHVIMRPALASLRLVCCEDPTTANRFEALGVAPERLFVSGNIKSDLHLAPDTRQAIDDIRASLGERPVLTAGSTHAGEDEALIDALRQHLAHAPDTLLILVPRHPERFDSVAALLQRAGLRHARRSLGQAPEPQTQVLLGDTMGELMLWYGVADACFVGGSLIGRGGHNPLEVLYLDKPLIAGPHTHNFARLYEALHADRAMNLVSDAAQVFAQFDALRADRPMRALQVARGRQHYLAMAGATRRTLEQLAPFARWQTPGAVLQERKGPDTVWADPACFARADVLMFDPAFWPHETDGIASGSGRGSIHQVGDERANYLLRHYYRGGLMARLSRDLFLAQRLVDTRAMAEFTLLRRLHARGLPVPQAAAARCRRHGPFYRADILVRWIPDARDVAQLLHQHRALSAQEWQSLGRAVRQLHDEQVLHCDLNCHNLMLDAQGKAWIVDFDKCGFRAGESWKTNNLTRLLRSLRKELRLDPALHWSEATHWPAFLNGYRLEQDAEIAPVAAHDPEAR